MNQRILKFRSWNGKEMINTGTINETTRESGYEMWDGDKLMYYPVMQFTGLLDKNGKEIYEGDVLKCSGAKKFPLNLVIWEPMKGRWLAKLIGANNFNIISGRKDVDYEIIGNIYSNPELIK